MISANPNKMLYRSARYEHVRVTLRDTIDNGIKRGCRLILEVVTPEPLLNRNYAAHHTPLLLISFKTQFSDLARALGFRVTPQYPRSLIKPVYTASLKVSLISANTRTVGWGF